MRDNHSYLRQLTRFRDEYDTNRERWVGVGKSLADYIRQRCVDESIIQPTPEQLESVELSFDGEPN